MTFKTAKQADSIGWALGAMQDAHEELYEDRPCGGASYEIPTLDGLVMTGGHPETIADLLYRIEVQIQDMSNEEFGRPDRPAMNAAKLIRDVTGVERDDLGNPLKVVVDRGGA